MKTRTILNVVIWGLILSIFAGCVQNKAKEAKETKLAPEAKKEAKLTLPKGGKDKMMLRFSPQQETNYKVVSESTKDYSFVQPSINKSKERHTVWRTEMVFAQKIESVDRQGNATADITIKKLKYLSQDPEGKMLDFDSAAESGKKDALFVIIGQSYKIKITPDGKVEVIDAKAAREAVKGESSAAKIAGRLLSDDEIIGRHQVLALNDAGKNPAKKGDKWSTVAASPAGMLRPKTFEKVYTLTDIKKGNGSNIATVTMEGSPSSKHIPEGSEKESVTSFFANMFDEKDNYNGKMVLNLTAGEIENYQELLKVEWLAVEPLKEKESDKTPDQLTMGFTNLYSIEKTE
ncbi:MAG: hypothetical protein ABSE89_11810 [Sedimentisphaerales bacterium]